MRAHVDESEFDPLDSPLLIERQQLVDLLFQRDVVHVDDDSDASLVCIADHLVQIERTLAPPGIERHRRRVGVRIVLRAVPACVVLDVLQTPLDGEVHAGLAACGR